MCPDNIFKQQFLGLYLTLTGNETIHLTVAVKYESNYTVRKEITRISS